MVAGVIDHFKVSNSREIRCPGGRAGHFLRQGTQTCHVDLQYIGPFDAGGGKLSVRFFGCTRVYDLIAHDGFVEIKPDEASEPQVAVETRIDVIRMTDHYGTEKDYAASESKPDAPEPMDEALNYLLRQLRDSQQRKAA